MQKIKPRAPFHTWKGKQESFRSIGAISPNIGKVIIPFACKTPPNNQAKGVNILHRLFL